MRKAFLYLHISVFLAGFTGPLGRLIEMNEGLLVWWRLFISSVTMWIVFSLMGKLQRISAKDILKLTGIGFLAAIHWVTFYGSIKYANVSVALVCFSAVGFFTALVEPVLLRVKNLYETASNNFLNNAIPSIIFFKQLTDSTSYCLYDVSDGVCLMTFVATQKSQQHYRIYKIQNECDADFSLPEYSHTNYKHDPTKRIITSTTHVEKSKSKYLIKDGTDTRFKEGYNFENAETIKYSMVTTLFIQRSGKITVQKK